MVSVEEKSRQKTVTGKDQGDEQPRTIDEVSKYLGWRQNWGAQTTPGQVQREPVYCLVGVRPRDGMNLIQAFGWNVGTCRSDAKGKPQVEDPQEGKY